jgi:hypothetical protein
LEHLRSKFLCLTLKLVTSAPTLMNILTASFVNILCFN